MHSFSTFVTFALAIVASGKPSQNEIIENSKSIQPSEPTTFNTTIAGTHNATMDDIGTANNTLTTGNSFKVQRSHHTKWYPEGGCVDNWWVNDRCWHQCWDEALHGGYCATGKSMRVYFLNICGGNGLKRCQCDCKY